METRAEERRRQRHEKRQLDERLISRLWSADNPPQATSPNISPTTTPPVTPTDTQAEHANEDAGARLERLRRERAEKRKQEEEAASKQAEDRAKAREERRKKMEAEEKEHEARMEERRKQREDRKKALTDLDEAAANAVPANPTRRESLNHLQLLAARIGGEVPLAPTKIKRDNTDNTTTIRDTTHDQEATNPSPTGDLTTNGDMTNLSNAERLQRLKGIGGLATISHFKTATPTATTTTTSSTSSTNTSSSTLATALSGNGSGVVVSAFGVGAKPAQPQHTTAPTLAVVKKRVPRGTTAGIESIMNINLDRKFPDKNKKGDEEKEKETEKPSEKDAYDLDKQLGKLGSGHKGRSKRQSDPKKKGYSTVSGSNPIAQLFPQHGSSIMMKTLLGVGHARDLTTTGRAIPDLPMPRKGRLTRDQLFKNGPDKPDLAVLKQHLLEEGRLEVSLLKDMIASVKEKFKVEKNILDIKAPVVICGDIHGQFYDLVALMEAAGDPSTTAYLFLGDYVDRGCFSTEVCAYLFACKLMYPNTFYLLRGNHESRQLAEYFNFKTECKFKYDDTMYDVFMDVFDHLPLAAIVKGTSSGPFFCVHGGLSPFIKTLADIEKIDRFVEPPYEGAYCDLLWSDPLVDQYELTQNEHTKVTYLQNSTRGCGYFYGYKAVHEFLTENGLVSIVRAHEVQQHGYSEYWYKQEEIIKASGGCPPVITVFSAPNYCDMYQNKAAYLQVENAGYTFKQIAWTEHPAYLPNFSNGIAFSLPVVLEQFAAFCLEFLKKTDEEEEEQRTNRTAREIADRMKQREEAIRKVMILMRKLRKDNESGLKQPVNDPRNIYDRNLSVFERALKYDRKNEVCRPKDYSKMYKTL
eukprot:TRINITY_DN3618_c0_g1_i1.p1 TRINITY_DN3618_c0_g1~~TRINITY_DN3618_c0_g1_i1.p1  ORF type:complete len:864 (-),score=206.06 TRINITY_DN3618_c0_g1_i1:61-2652(-)